MAKFAVGEKVEFIKARVNKSHKYVGMCAIIKEIGPYEENYIFPDGEPTRLKSDYWIVFENGHDAAVLESQIRKLPGDSLPSWLTNMLTLPASDPDKVKQPEKVK